MCGRYSFITTEKKVKQQFALEEGIGGLRQSYNIAPTQHAYVITNDAPHRLQYITWGLIPYWSKVGENKGRLINARAEGISSKPSFRLPIRQGRCLVLADSFYEWRNMGGNKVPHRIFLKNGDLLAFAGIWDTWKKDDYQIKSFSIITTEPNAEMQGLHNRMPVILNHPLMRELWLGEQSLPTILDLLHTPEDGILDHYPVSPKLNAVQNNSPELHQRLEAPPTLF